MILGDVQKPGCIGMKVTDAFELERGGFRNNGVARARFGCMFGNWNADVAENKRLAFAVCFEYFAGKRSGCGFSVRAADAHKMRSSAAITITEDMKPVIPGLEEALSGIEYTDKLGEAPETLLDGVDLMIISPVIPIFAPFVRKAQSRGIEVIGEIELGWNKFVSAAVRLFRCGRSAQRGFEKCADAPS